jgi:hypothetical protein
MGTKKIVSTTINKRNVKINLIVNTISLEENGVQIVYCPSLKVYGYGNTKREAITSFKICLKEYTNSVFFAKP